jgi:peptidoglycan/LPS O-acetylase OafA/YrhL
MSERDDASAAESISGYRIQLDGLRAIAVVMTMVFHWTPPGVVWKSWFPFNISGVRLVPAYYFLLIVGAILGIGAIRSTLPWHLAYLSNVNLIVEGRWLPGVFHLWSLAIEEQFYIGWALLILLAPRRWLLPCVVGAVVLAPIFRSTGVALGWANMTIRLNPVACLDSLGMGALLAFLVRPEWSGRWVRWREPFLRGCLWTGLPLLAVTILGLNLHGGNWNRNVNVPIQELALALVFTWLVARAAVGFRGPFGAFLSNAVVVKIGVVSYALYLYHPIVGPWLRQALPRDFPFSLWLAASTAVTFGAAWLSWVALERPVKRLGRHFAYTRD